MTALLGPLLIGGGALASGLLGSNAAQQASGAQVGVEQQGLALQENALAQQTAARGQLQPYIGAGNNALSTIAKMYGPNANYSQFTNSPDYQFALQQGNLGLQRYENANGLALSGGALKDVAQFNQGLASQQFGNYYNRLMGLAQLGQGAAQANANSAFQGVQGANAAAGTLGQIGQSQAGGIVGSANAITGGINSGISNSLLYNAINRNNNPSGYFGGTGLSGSPWTFGG